MRGSHSRARLVDEAVALVGDVETLGNLEPPNQTTTAHQCHSLFISTNVMADTRHPL